MADVTKLVELGACEDAVEWCRTQPSLRQAWRVCRRGDWMLWYAERVGVELRRLVWVACQCARLTLRHVPDGEPRPRRAIEAAEAWAEGRDWVTLADVRAAAAEAAAAARWAETTAPWPAEAAWAAAEAAWASEAATFAAEAATAAAEAAHTEVAEADVLAECATICRREWPTLPGKLNGEPS